MKTTWIIVFIVITFNTFSQNPFLIGFKEFYHPAHGYFAPDEKQSSFSSISDSTLTAYEANHLNIDSPMLITLSLLDQDRSITNNWEQFKEKHRDGSYLLIVSNRDDGAKGDFAVYFYQQRAKGLDLKSAYEGLKAANIQPGQPRFYDEELITQLDKLMQG